MKHEELEKLYLNLKIACTILSQDKYFKVILNSQGINRLLNGYCGDFLYTPKYVSNENGSLVKIIYLFDMRLHQAFIQITDGKLVLSTDPEVKFATKVICVDRYCVVHLIKWLSELIGSSCGYHDVKKLESDDFIKDMLGESVLAYILVKEMTKQYEDKYWTYERLKGIKDEN